MPAEMPDGEIAPRPTETPVPPQDIGGPLAPVDAEQKGIRVLSVLAHAHGPTEIPQPLDQNESQIDSESSESNVDVQQEEPESSERRMLVMKAKSVAEKATESVANVNLLVEADTLGVVPEEESMPLEDQLDALLDEEPEDIGYLSRSRHVVEASRTQINEINQAIYRDIDRLEEIDRRLVEVHAATGQDKESIAEKIKVFFGSEEYNAAQAWKVSEKEKAPINERIKDAKDEVLKLHWKTIDVGKKHDDMLIAKAGESLRGIVNAFDGLSSEIADNPDIQQEIWVAYKEMVIDPQVAERVDSHLADPEDRDRLNSLFAEASMKAKSGEDISDMKTRIDEVTRRMGISVRYEDLFNGRDLYMVTEVLAHAAASYAQTVLDTANNAILIGSAEDKLTAYISPGYTYAGIVPFGAEVKREINRHSSEPREFHNPKLWNALKQSETAQEIMGPYIEEQDTVFREAFLNKAMKDTEGGKIMHLKDYPHPDTVKTIVLIAGAHPYEYRRANVLRAFAELRDNPKWSELAAQTVDKYPELSSVLPIMESWNIHNQDLPEGFQSAADTFALRIWSDEMAKENPNKSAVGLAIESMSNNARIDAIVSMGNISAEDGEVIKDAIATIKEVGETQSVDEETDLPVISVQKFDNYTYRILNGVLRSGKPMYDRNVSDMRLENMNVLAHAIHANKVKPEVLAFFTNETLLGKIDKDKVMDESYITAFNEIPLLLKDSYVADQFATQFDGPETVRFFKDVSTTYGEDIDSVLVAVILVGEGSLSQERVLELKEKAAGIIQSGEFASAAKYPSVFLETDTDIDYFGKFKSSYEQFADRMDEAAAFIQKGTLTREAALLFPKHATALMAENMGSTRHFIFENSTTMIQNPEDLKMLNAMVGAYGQKADSLIRGYKASLDAGVVTLEDRQLVLEFSKKFRVISPAIIDGYKAAVAGGTEELYIAELDVLANKFVGNGDITIAEQEKPYYKDLLTHVYVNNAGQYTNPESNDSCADRSTDLEGFHIMPRYEIDLLSQSIVRVKVGEELDPDVKESVQAPIYALADRIRAAGGPEAIKEEVSNAMGIYVTEIQAAGGLEGIDLDAITTDEEKLFLILTDSIYGTQSVDQAEVKNLMLTYEFANYQDINDYIQGTSDRVSLASNQDYALFCEVNEFYGDRIKEVNRKVAQDAWKNPVIKDAMEGYFNKVVSETQSSSRQDAINRLQLDKLGMNDAFLQQVGKTLKAKSGREYTPDQLRRIIEMYEKVTNGLDSEREKDKARIERQQRASLGDAAYDEMAAKERRKITTGEQMTQSFYGQLKSQKEKTLEAVKVISGETIDPASVHLGEINLQELLAAEATFQTGTYNPEQFAAYTVQRFLNIFDDEKVAIQSELNKFESESGKQQEILNAYITKSKASANARMVGGVCVSGDNPVNAQTNRATEKNMWDMPNYMQIVLQDPESLRCQGLILMHHFEEDGKKFLSVSLNPSSTYLYSVDEKALFSGLMATVETFASDNNFDAIVLSKSKTIRTNRTGGEFENAMDARVAAVGQEIQLSEKQQFSYDPNYQLDRVDVVWEKPEASR